MHFTHKATFGLTLLTGAVFAAPVCAQQLDLGQSGSTTLSGTATLKSTGTTASGPYSYNDAGTGKTLTKQNSYDNWNAYGTSKATITGGVIGKTYVNGLTMHDTSTANVSGGTIFDLFADDTSVANVTGGSIRFLETYNTAATNFSGGYVGPNDSFGGGFFTHDNSTANISGGTISILGIDDVSTANITGGIIDNLSTENSGTANVSGGTISTLDTVSGMVNFSGGTTNNFYAFGGTANISGGAINSLELNTLTYKPGFTIGTADVTGGIINLFQTDTTNTLNLFGTDLMATEQYEPASAGFREFALSGTLLNGDPLNALYKDYGGKGTLNLNGVAAVPEASTLVSTGLLICLGGLIVGAHRRKATTAG